MWVSGSKTVRLGSHMYVTPRYSYLRHHGESPIRKDQTKYKTKDIQHNPNPSYGYKQCSFKSNY